MHIDLIRTFSEYSNSASDRDDEDWTRYLNSRLNGHTWADLHTKPVVVVLGEAGIGKTVEFQQEVERLRAANNAAFFIPLNQVNNTESWKIVLTGRDVEFEAWTLTDELGYFFLDAVDEARLRSHADFERALTIVQRELGPYLARVRIALSSRVTDWSTPCVRIAVDVRLTKPIERAIVASAVAAAPGTTPDSRPWATHEASATPQTDAFVISMDPLSNSEARRCAAAFGLQDEPQFWMAVANGDYEFMATRPLDLGWMVAIWNQSRTFGAYHELIATNISNRLRDSNTIYETAGEVLSASKLLEGASTLAATAEFGGCGFFTLDVGIVPQVGELSPHAVLIDWQPTAVRRLLATAVFDEASFGRVKFHHRAVREFLAAEWVARQLILGVPLLRLQGLFTSFVYGHHVLIPARRASLSWLAAISVIAREWVIREFPEILLFQGDPEAWDNRSADEAFANLIERSEDARLMSWFKSASEFRRVGRVLSPGTIALALANSNLPSAVRSICFQIARHAKLSDCAKVSFTIYRDNNAPEWERIMALDVLKLIGTSNHREAVLADLRAGLLRTNPLVAHAIPATDWMNLTDAELSGIFDFTQNDQVQGAGTMVHVIKRELLTTTDTQVALLLLRAVKMSLPASIESVRLVQSRERGQPERAWLLDVLPACLKRVLELLSHPSSSCREVCIEAAQRIDALGSRAFKNKDELNYLSAAIVQHTDLRWDIGLAIAQSDDVWEFASRLVSDDRCLVTFGVTDLADLSTRANDSTRSCHEREVWFKVAMNVAFRLRGGHERASALRELGLKCPESSRIRLIRGQYDRCRSDAKYKRDWAAEERRRIVEDDLGKEKYKLRLFENIESIRNGTDINSLSILLQYCHSRLGRMEYSDVDFQDLATSLNPEIALAFETGLITCWPNLTPPDPADYSAGTLPWQALLGIAGLRKALVDDTAISLLSREDAANAARMAVWESYSPPLWFDALARSHQAEVGAALGPWLLAAARSASSDSGVGRTLELVLRCSPDVRRDLMAQLVPLVAAGQINRLETLEAVVSAMREDGQLPPAMVGGLCLNRLLSSTRSEGGIGEMTWLRVWMETDISTAWLWFQGHLQRIVGDVGAEVKAFVMLVADLKWLHPPISIPAAKVLLDIYALVKPLIPDVSSSNVFEARDFFGPHSRRLCDGILSLFRETRGPLGHDSLVALFVTFNHVPESSKIAEHLAEHAALDAMQMANRTHAELNSISSPFLSAPSTEAQLYEQVIARLEEIRKNIEEGPFSERDLFYSGIPEKFLQRWLAAKFSDTQNRRFSVHREEQVDDDKMTDIQLSCPAGNVCVEIKPVDAMRSYSAVSLTDTLQTQIVGQYLRGSNSSRGILVLVQLDVKTWHIPGGSNGQHFNSLVQYLKNQAQSIKRGSANVNELEVFALRCVV